MWDLNLVDKEIEELESGKFCWCNIDKLAHLYIIRENLENEMHMSGNVEYLRAREEKGRTTGARNEIGFRAEYNGRQGGNGNGNGGNSSRNEIPQYRGGRNTIFDMAGKSTGSANRSKTGVAMHSEHRKLMEELDYYVLVEIMDVVLNHLMVTDNQAYQDCVEKMRQEVGKY